MSEDLDFEAEIPSNFNVETLSIKEVDASNEDAIHFDNDDTVDGTGEIQSNCNEVENDTVEIQSSNTDIESDINIIQFNMEENHFDDGEIQSSSEENLEEGEIEDKDLPPNKNVEETVCRFFKQGYCLYGSECRNLHVSNKIYNMFEPVLINRSNLNSLQLQNTHKLAAFHPTPLLIMPDIESPWERGIRNAKIVIENANIKKSNEGDIENDWQRCLEQAKQCIEKKTNSGRQNCDGAKPYFDLKYYEQRKFREKETGKEVFITNRQKSLFSYCKESNSKNKSKSDVKQTPDHLKWVDPWQRSKSPRKRTVSFSISPSPPMKHTRKRSVSSSSSSSFVYERIYGNSHQKKSPEKFRSASRSTSVYSCTKKSNTIKKHTKGRGRSYLRSPRKSCCSGSCSSRTSSGSSDDLYAKKKSNVKAIPENKLVSKNKKYCLVAKNSKDVYQSSFIKHSSNKASGRASSPCHSDKSSSSDLSMTSLSYTSLSSAGKSTLKNINTKTTEGNAFSRSLLVDKVPQDVSQNAPKPEQGYRNSNTFNKFSTVSDQKRLLSPDRKKLLMYKATSIKTKCVETATSEACLKKQVSLLSKSPVTKNVTNQKPSKATMELLKYHSFARKNNSESTLTIDSRPKTISPILTEATKSTPVSKTSNSQTKESEKALPKITSNMHLKLQKPLDSAAMLKIKEAGSKRRLLLQQLQAIEDAIARKKQPEH